jgi:ubiquinone/menaquinone biosynthesis C-methylase UbiE
MERLKAEEPMQSTAKKVGQTLSSAKSLLTTSSEYGLPMDEAELDRIDMCHAKYCALIGKNKYLAPIDSPQKILDLGCGTGWYSLDYFDCKRVIQPQND